MDKTFEDVLDDEFINIFKPIFYFLSIFGMRGVTIEYKFVTSSTVLYKTYCCVIWVVSFVCMVNGMIRCHTQFDNLSTDIPLKAGILINGCTNIFLAWKSVFHHGHTNSQLYVKLQRIERILKIKDSRKTNTKGINSYAIPVLTYSFGVINWTKTELKNLQRLINVTMTKHRKHHPRACIQRQILPRSEGGRGIIDIHNLHNKQIITLRSYFHSKSETSSLHKSVVQLDQQLTPLNLQDRNRQNNENLIDRQTLITEWTRKSLHGRHHHDLSHPTVDIQASNEWLSRGELFPETEGFMIAIQDQVIETRNYQKHIMKVRNLPTEMCRRCNSNSETIQHITGACKAIAQTDYKFRHDQVANVIHQSLAIKYKLIETTAKPTPYYKYTPETVLENTTHKLYFDRAILTDKTTHFNRPDLTLLNKTNNTALLIDIAVPNTHNLQSTIAEKLSKYVDLKNEITRMWRLQKVSIIPIVLSTTGVIPKQLRPAKAHLCFVTKSSYFKHV